MDEKIKKKVEGRIQFKDSFDIKKEKAKISNDIIKKIKEYNLDYKEIALNLGMTNEQIASYLLNPENESASSLLLISDNVKLMIENYNRINSMIKR